MKSLDELLDPQSAWLVLKEWFTQATNRYEILASYPENAGKELHGMQLPTRSPLGAMIYETGGVLIDYGWLRLLGSGNEKLPRGVFEWNFGKTFEASGEQPPYLLVADDILGGYFAINAGGLGDKIGQIYYYHPKKAEWQCQNLSYSEFLGWALMGDLNDFYADLRWQNWQTDIANLNGSQVYNPETKTSVPVERHYQATFNADDKYSFGYSVN